MFNEFWNKTQDFFKNQNKKQKIQTKFSLGADYLIEKAYFCVRFTQMKKLKEYIIPISGLSEGVHQFDFQIEDAFFEHFEASPIKKANLRVDFYFEKQMSMYVLIFEVNGKVSVECDRCLEEFEMPIKSSNTLIAKFDASEADDAEVIYIPQTAIEIDVTEFIYEFIVLSVPLMRKHQDAGEECPEDVFSYLDNEEEAVDETPKNNPFLDALKKFKDE